jgi:hypothetical protein
MAFPKATIVHANADCIQVRWGSRLQGLSINSAARRFLGLTRACERAGGNATLIVAWGNAPGYVANAPLGLSI